MINVNVLPFDVDKLRTGAAVITNTGMIGKLIEDDGSCLPFRVHFNNGGWLWFNKEGIAMLDDRDDIELFILEAVLPEPELVTAPFDLKSALEGQEVISEDGWRGTFKEFYKSVCSYLLFEMTEVHSGNIHELHYTLDGAWCGDEDDDTSALKMVVRG